MISSIFKHLIAFQRFYPHNQEPFSLCMDGMVTAIMESLQCHDKVETLKGAIKLCECVLAIADEQQFEHVYTTMAAALRGAADTQIANFNADILMLQSQ